MINTIEYPNTTKWFVCLTEESNIISYGEVMPNEIMITGQPIMDVYENEEDWAIYLIDNGINPYPEEEVEPPIITPEDIDEI
tara:strand:- start:3079 stop:3324 length:246 start_codon:yes stop_codon:yes gene_type:complete